MPFNSRHVGRGGRGGVNPSGTVQLLLGRLFSITQKLNNFTSLEKAGKKKYSTETMKMARIMMPKSANP